jgi:hypothetical protein
VLATAPRRCELSSAGQELRRGRRNLHAKRVRSPNRRFAAIIDRRYSF